MPAFLEAEGGRIKKKESFKMFKTIQVNKKVNIVVATTSGIAMGFNFQRGDIYLPNYIAQKYFKVDGLIITSIRPLSFPYQIEIKGHYKDSQICEWLPFKSKVKTFSVSFWMTLYGAKIFFLAEDKKEYIELLPDDEEEFFDDLDIRGACDLDGETIYRRVEGTTTYIQFDKNANPIRLWSHEAIKTTPFIEEVDWVDKVKKDSDYGRAFYQGLGYAGSIT